MPHIINKGGAFHTQNSNKRGLFSKNLNSIAPTILTAIRVRLLYRGDQDKERTQ